MAVSDKPQIIQCVGLDLLCGAHVVPAHAKALLLACLHPAADLPVTLLSAAEAAAPAAAGQLRLAMHRAPVRALARMLEGLGGTEDAASRGYEQWSADAAALLGLTGGSGEAALLVDVDAAVAQPDAFAARLRQHLGRDVTPPDPLPRIPPLAEPPMDPGLEALAALMLEMRGAGLCRDLAGRGLIAPAPAPHGAPACDILLARMQDLAATRACDAGQADSMAGDLALARETFTALLAARAADIAQLEQALAQARALPRDTGAADRHKLAADALQRIVGNLRKRQNELSRALESTRARESAGAARLAEERRTAAQALAEAQQGFQTRQAKLARALQALEIERDTLLAQQARNRKQMSESADLDKALKDKLDEALQTAQAEREALLVRLGDQDREAARRLADLHRDHDKARHAWEKQTRSQADLETRLRGKIAGLEKDLGEAMALVGRREAAQTQQTLTILELQDEITRLNDLYSETMTSTSWRITAPLRGTKLLTRRLLDRPDAAPPGSDS